ncbi:MAG: hypothetical protein NT062_31190 [Proteobacteria bacterium]|nr:hypothetical protein [Pseudomonadota bacterium]
MMKRWTAIGIGLAALAACGNKGPSSSTECAAAIDSAVAIGVGAQVQGQHLGDATIAAMKAITAKHCTEDQWTVEVVTCLKAGKTNDVINTCLEGIPLAARVRWQTEMAAELARAGSAGAGSAGAGSAGSTGSGSAVGSGSATLPAPVDVPPDCVAYRQIMERLATCEAFPKLQRDAYTQAYTKIFESLETQTGAARAQLAQGCKTTVDVIRQSAGATCGW